MLNVRKKEYDGKLRYIRDSSPHEHKAICVCEGRKDKVSSWHFSPKSLTTRYHLEFTHMHTHMHPHKNVNTDTFNYLNSTLFFSWPPEVNI